MRQSSRAEFSLSRQRTPSIEGVGSLRWLLDDLLAAALRGNGPEPVKDDDMLVTED